MSKGKVRVNTGGDAERLSLDTVYHLLSSEYRRYTLYYLYQHENPAQLTDVAKQVAQWGRSKSSLSEDHRQTYEALYHNHVPKLAASSVVAYGHDGETIELAENGAQLRPYLEDSAARDLPEIGAPVL